MKSVTKLLIRIIFSVLFIYLIFKYNTAAIIFAILGLVADWSPHIKNLLIKRHREKLIAEMMNNMGDKNV